MKFLHTVAKLIPKLGTDNEHEKLATLNAIERILRSNELTWTDIGQQLAGFVTHVAGAELPPPEPEKPKGWSKPAAPPPFTPPPRPAPQAPPQAQWTPPPRQARNQAPPNQGAGFAPGSPGAGHHTMRPQRPSGGWQPRGNFTDKIACIAYMLHPASNFVLSSKEERFLRQLMGVCQARVSYSAMQETQLEALCRRNQMI